MWFRQSKAQVSCHCQDKDIDGKVSKAMLAAPGAVGIERITQSLETVPACWAAVCLAYYKHRYTHKFLLFCCWIPYSVSSLNHCFLLWIVLHASIASIAHWVSCILVEFCQLPSLHYTCAWSAQMDFLDILTSLPPSSTPAPLHTPQLALWISWCDHNIHTIQPVWEPGRILMILLEGIKQLPSYMLF